MATQPPPYAGANGPGYPPAPGSGGPGGYAPVPPPGYGSPPPPKSNRVWWIVGGSVAGLLVLCCVGGFVLSALFGVGIARGASGLMGNISGAQQAATNYYDAIAAHDWTGAQGYLDSSARATTSATSLQATWTRREAANGRVTGFSAKNTNVSTTNGKTTATVTGTVSYATGSPEEKFVRLVKEGSDWKLSAPLP